MPYSTACANHAHVQCYENKEGLESCMEPTNVANGVMPGPWQLVCQYNCTYMTARSHATKPVHEQSALLQTHILQLHNTSQYIAAGSDMAVFQHVS